MVEEEQKKRPRGRGKRWSRREDAELLRAVGNFGYQKMLRRLDGRSLGSLRARGRRLWGSASLSRGSKSLIRLVEETGYARSQLRRAERALGQRWPRTSPTGRYVVSDDLVDDMVAWLAHDYWAKSLELYACIECGRKDRPHRSIGLCSPDYYAWRRLARVYRLPAAPGRLLRLLPEELDGLLVDNVKTLLGEGCAVTRLQLAWISGVLACR